VLVLRLMEADDPVAKARALLSASPPATPYQLRVRLKHHQYHRGDHSRSYFIG
jgi:hypothetical protein